MANDQTIQEKIELFLNQFLNEKTKLQIEQFIVTLKMFMLETKEKGQISINIGKYTLTAGKDGEAIIIKIENLKTNKEG